MRILFLGQKGLYRRVRQRKGTRIEWQEELFREELGRHVDVVYYGPYYGPYNDCVYSPKFSVSQIIEKCGGQFDLILRSVDYKWFFKGFNDINIPKVFIGGEYLEGGPLVGKYNKLFIQHKVDLSFGYSSLVVDYLKKNNIGKKTFLLPGGVDINIFKNLYLKKTIDIMASWNIRHTRKTHICCHPQRVSIKKMIRENFSNYFISRAFFDKDVVMKNKSKIAINNMYVEDPNMNTPISYVNYRLPATLACGTFLLTDKSKDAELFGYKNKKHLVFYDDLKDLKDKIEYYLEHSEEREEIAKNGYNFVRKYYSTTERVKKFISIIKKELNII